MSTHNPMRDHSLCLTRVSALGNTTYRNRFCHLPCAKSTPFYRKSAFIATPVSFSCHFHTKGMSAYSCNIKQIARISHYSVTNAHTSQRLPIGLSTHIKHGIFNLTDKSSAYCKASSDRYPITGPHGSYYCRTLGGPYG